MKRHKSHHEVAPQLSSADQAGTAFFVGGLVAKSVRLSILSLCLLMPLLISTLGTDRYITPKRTCLIWIAAFVGMALVVFRATLRCSRVRLRLRLPMLLFLLVCSLSLFGGICLGRSTRALVTWFALLAIYQGICSFFGRRSSWVCLGLVQVGATLASLLLLVTGLGLVAVKEPMASTFGNRNFLSEYIVLTLPVGVALLFAIRSFWAKRVVLAGICAQFLALVLASSQGAWVGCVASLFVLAWFQRSAIRSLFADRDYRPLSRAARVRLSLGAVSIVLGLIVVSVYTKGPNIMQDTMRSVNLRHRNVQMRLQVWKASSKMIVENVFLGTGLGSYNRTFPRFRDPQEWNFTGIHTQANWAHNALIHTASETGILGLLAFLWLVFSCVFLGGRLAAEKPGSPRSLVFASLGAAWFGTFVCSLVGTNFHLPANLFLLATYAGLLDNQMGTCIGNCEPLRMTRRVVLAVCLAPLVLLGIGVWIVLPYLGDQILAWGIREFNAGRTTASVGLLDRAFHIYPRTKSPRFHRALVAYQLKENKQAVSIYRKLAYEYPNDLQVHYNLGLALEEDGRLNEASGAYARAIDLHPRFLMAYERIGKALALQGRHEQALAFLENATEQGSEDPLTWTMAGDQAAELEQFERAAEFYERAVRLTAANGTVWYNMGLYWQKAGRLEPAIAAYRQAISRDPNLAFAYNNLGLCLMLSGKFREAGEVLSAGLHRDERSPDIHFNLALIQRIFGDDAKAERHLERAKELAPERKHIQVTVDELDDWLDRMR